MRFLSARQVISFAYRGEYSAAASYAGLGQMVSPPRRCCPDCHSAEIEKREGKNREVDAVWVCFHCQGKFKRPVYALGRGGVDPGNSAGYVTNGWLICNGLQRGQVRAVVDALPGYQFSWLMYAYTDHLEQRWVDHYEAMLVDWLAQEIDRNPPCKMTDFHSFRTAVRLLLLVLMDAREMERNGRELYSDYRMAKELWDDEDKRSNFRKGLPWRRLADAARGLLDTLNADALRPVAELVDAERKKVAA